jgi:hypothetical protein
VAWQINAVPLKRFEPSDPPHGDGHRNGAVCKRSQLKIKTEGEEHWTKRDKENGPVHGPEKERRKIQGRPARNLNRRTARSFSGRQQLRMYQC